jgi:CheY-like chemotaxis protein
MDEEFTQKIFTKFQQADKSSSRRFGGTGLGMAITKELIEMMNGRITVQSEKGVGTEVRAQLMLPVGDVTKTEMANNLPMQVALENRSVLLVEDNEMNRMVAINALLPYKMIVTQAENGLEAIEALKKDTFDLILMDLQMPVMGGLEAMRILRQSLKIKTPVVALTANAFKSEIDLCINAGMADYVVKPFEEKNLIQAIAKALAINNKSSSQEQLNTTIFSEAAEADSHLYDLTKLKALSRGDEAFVLKMLGLFADMMPRAITEMQTAVNAQDFENLQKVMHRIKPSVDNMGIVSIRSHIREIEQADSETDRLLMMDHTRFIADVLERVVAEVRRSELHPPTS